MNFAPLNILFLDFRDVSWGWMVGGRGGARGGGSVSLQHHRNIRRSRAICIKYEYYNINLRIVAVQHNSGGASSLSVHATLKRDINIPENFVRDPHDVLYSLIYNELIGVFAVAHAITPHLPHLCVDTMLRCH